MSMTPEHNPIRFSRSAEGLEPLPGDFEADLHRLDAMLGRQIADAAQTPADLAQRVFEASVADLPGRESGRSPTIVRQARAWWRAGLVPTPAWRGRLALAASFALVFALSMVFYQHSAPMLETPEEVAVTGDEDSPVTAPPAAEVRMVAMNYDWLDDEPLEDVEAEVSYLLDTGGMGSFAEVTNELEAVLSGIDM